MAGKIAHLTAALFRDKPFALCPRTAVTRNARSNGKTRRKTRRKGHCYADQKRN